MCTRLGDGAGPSPQEAGQGAGCRRAGCSPGPVGGVAGGSPCLPLPVKGGGDHLPGTLTAFLVL